MMKRRLFDESGKHINCSSDKRPFILSQLGLGIWLLWSDMELCPFFQ